MCILFATNSCAGGLADSDVLSSNDQEIIIFQQLEGSRELLVGDAHFTLLLHLLVDGLIRTSAGCHSSHAPEKQSQHVQN